MRLSNSVRRVRPWMMAAFLIPFADQSQDTTGLVGVIGHWTEVAEGQPIIVVDGSRLKGIPTIVVDGTKWSGKTTPDALLRASMQLFGAPNDFL